VPGQSYGFYSKYLFFNFPVCHSTNAVYLPVTISELTSLNYFGNNRIKQTNLGNKKAVYV